MACRCGCLRWGGWVGGLRQRSKTKKEDCAGNQNHPPTHPLTCRKKAVEPKAVTFPSKASTTKGSSRNSTSSPRGRSSNDNASSCCINATASASNRSSKRAMRPGSSSNACKSPKRRSASSPLRRTAPRHTYEKEARAVKATNAVDAPRVAGWVGGWVGE